MGELTARGSSGGSPRNKRLGGNRQPPARAPWELLVKKDVRSVQPVSPAGAVCRETLDSLQRPSGRTTRAHASLKSLA